LRGKVVRGRRQKRYTGENAADAAEETVIKLEVVKLPTAKGGFVLLLADGWWGEVSVGCHGLAAGAGL
jgi:hypothetical protein